MHRESAVPEPAAKKPAVGPDRRGSAAGADPWGAEPGGSSAPAEPPGLPSPATAALSERLRLEQERALSTPKVQRMAEFRKKLPAFGKKAELVAAVASSQVVVVSGETGCGKTTQLPQFILEEEIAAGRGAACGIICTQPRRISAISVAQRVADERGEELGRMVGYQIRLESRRSDDTRLLFCTSGVVLRRLAGDPLLRGVSHIVVDEIHERGMNEDFLLIILRDLLPRRPDLRVVLMSATLNADLFCGYFGGCPRLHIPGFTFPVEELFLEDFLDLTRHEIAPPDQSGGRGGGPSSRARGGRGRLREAAPPQDPGGGTLGWVFRAEDYPNAHPSTCRSLAAWQQANSKGDAKLDLDLVAAVVTHICRNEPEGAILVFMTGWDDISKLHDQLKARPLTGDPSRCLLLPLHGSMPTVNQQAIFSRPPQGVRKVILSTNIAETSITIDDIVYVVNGGKTKEKNYDPLNNLATLLPAWTSKAAARQRRGRAGRVQAGKCFHLLPRAMHDRHLLDHQEPELLRTPLEELCLQIKALRLGRVEAFLGRALQPPDQKAVHNAVDLLFTIGALSGDEELTPLGEHLAHLPVDPRIGKMMIMGAIFGCLEPVLIIAAGMAHRDPFVLPLEKKAEADRMKKDFAAGSRSDHIAILHAFQGWRRAFEAGGFSAARNYCWRSFLAPNTMQMMQEMVLQFAYLLDDIGFLSGGAHRGHLSSATGDSGEYDGEEQHPRQKSGSRDSLKTRIASLSKNQSNTELLRAVLCAGMFPAVASIKRRGKFNVFNTREDGKVEPHPSSVNSPMDLYPHRWLVYNDKVKTSGIYMRCSTMIPDYALLLLGGQLSQNSGKITMLEGWMAFSADQRVTELILGLRNRLDSLLAAKVNKPGLDVMEEGGPIVEAVIQLLESTAR
uniref:RNA helicase n=1 Tax=Tetraselmis sp. GSL018 TaxID=582737 RepID=A0A061S817_9CHLO